MHMKSDPSAATNVMFFNRIRSYKVGEKAIVTHSRFSKSVEGRAMVTIETELRVLGIRLWWNVSKKAEQKFWKSR